MQEDTRNQDIEQAGRGLGKSILPVSGFSVQSVGEKFAESLHYTIRWNGCVDEEVATESMSLVLDVAKNHLEKLSQKHRKDVVCRAAVDAFFRTLMDDIDESNKHDFGGFASVEFDGEDDKLEELARNFYARLLEYYNDCEKRQK
jgi:hypothetical protein